MKIQPGDRFGKLMVIALGDRVGETQYFDTVRCECGTVKKVRRSSLQSGDIQSCGCGADHYRHNEFGEMLTKHGFAKTKFYVWWNSRRRTVGNFYVDWQNDFANVVRDVGERVVDRMEKDGLKPYRPDRFAPYSARNFEMR